MRAKISVSIWKTVKMPKCSQLPAFKRSHSICSISISLKMARMFEFSIIVIKRYPITRQWKAALIIALVSKQMFMWHWFLFFYLRVGEKTHFVVDKCCVKFQPGKKYWSPLNSVSYFFRKLKRKFHNPFSVRWLDDECYEKVAHLTT